MVDHLSRCGCQVEMAMYFIIEEGADSCCPQSERFGGEIELLSDGACLQMHITVPAIAVGADGPIHIGDHRECYACVSGEVLPEAQAGGRDALIAGADLLQLGAAGPVAVYAGL